MSTDDIGSRQAAILSADVNTDGLFVRESEADAVQTLPVYLDALIAIIRQHRGGVVNSLEDGVLAEFAGVADAVQAAITIQRDLSARNAMLTEERQIEFRIGIHLGDVTLDGDRIYGDGVDMASRMQTLAQPGGICITRSVYDQIAGELPLEYEYLGKEPSNDIPKSIAAYRVLFDSEESTLEKGPEKKAGQTEKPGQSADILGETYRRRKNRSKTRLSRQLRTFMIVNGFLFVINILTYRGYWWIIWPVLGWGLLILLRLKRTGPGSTDQHAVLETHSFLQTNQPPNEKKDPRQIIIQVEPKDSETGRADTVNIKVPVQVLKAGVKLSAFLPEHVQETVAEALQTKGFDFDTLTKNEEIDIFAASLSGLNIVVEKDDAKVMISCK